MKESIVSRCVVGLLLMSGLSGCEKRSGEAIVIGKDYVAATKQGEEVKDERATNHEQWIVKVRMRDNGRVIQVRADRTQWEKLRENARYAFNLPNDAQLVVGLAVPIGLTSDSPDYGLLLLLPAFVCPD